MNNKQKRIQEINARLGELETREFMLQMIDFQSESDKRALRDIWEEQRKLNKELEGLTAGKE